MITDKTPLDRTYIRECGSEDASDYANLIYMLSSYGRGDNPLLDAELDKLLREKVREEVFMALKLDGGLAGAREALGRIERGELRGDGYYFNNCACFYGSLSLASGQPLADELAGWAEYSDSEMAKRHAVEKVSVRLRDQVMEALPEINEAGRDCLSPVEVLLSEFDVQPGDTHQTHFILTLMHDVLTEYVQEQEAAQQ